MAQKCQGIGKAPPECNRPNCSSDTVGASVSLCAKNALNLSQIAVKFCNKKVFEKKGQTTGQIADDGYI